MKKILKYLIITVVVIILIGTIFFLIDYNRVSKQEKPLFCIETTAVRDGGTTFYLGLGYKVIDFNRIGGFDEIKIGTWSMSYYDFKDEIEECEKEYYEKLRQEEAERIKEVESEKDKNEKEQEDRILKGKKIKANIKDDTLFDDLNLHVGDIYNVQGKDNRIVVFCSVISGEYPKVGDVFYIETYDSQYVYEIVVASIEQSSNSEVTELLLVYFDGVETDDIKATPQIRRLK